jgi:hypothetical protein
MHKHFSTKRLRRLSLGREAGAKPSNAVYSTPALEMSGSRVLSACIVIREPTAIDARRRLS